MKRKPGQFHVQSSTGRWLYAWADDTVNKALQTVPVWTHDKDKALLFTAFDAALAVGKCRKWGYIAIRLPA